LAHDAKASLLESPDRIEVIYPRNLWHN